MKLKYLAYLSALTIIGTVFTNIGVARAQSPCSGRATQSEIYSPRRKLALKGQDVVAYFTQKKVVLGTSQFIHKWKGVNWQFSSAANRDLFAKEPAKYAPQFGGYCAHTLVTGKLVSTNADFWEIVDGKLYLYASKDSQAQWRTNITENISKANRNWLRMLGSLS